MIIPLLTGITFAVMRHTNPVQVDSPCRIVEIYESIEENITRIVPEKWVFGEYDVAAKEVLRLDAAALLPIARQWFHLGPTIWCDM